MLVYRSGALESNPFVLYDYQKTRKADHPREFLKGFKGYCLTDGYQVYHTIDRERDDITVAGCWAHARRGFADVIKASPKDDPDLPELVAYKALQIIQTMYRYEKAYADKSAEERKNLRTRECAPLVDAFFAYLKAESKEVAEKSKTGKAIAYCLNQEKYLRVFLSANRPSQLPVNIQSALDSAPGNCKILITVPLSGHSSMAGDRLRRRNWRDFLNSTAYLVKKTASHPACGGVIFSPLAIIEYLRLEK